MKYLHVIAFDIPYPANYGGVIVVYYHLKALSEAGVQVILHAFQYDDRVPAVALEQICHQVYYYPRAKRMIDQFDKRPFIVQSRSNPLLLERLKADNYPIFFEGHHTCAFLGHPDLAARQKIVRVHNIEAQYYKNLADLESNLFKKLYFELESKKLKAFDAELVQHATFIITLSPDDFDFYKKKKERIHYIPPFHAENKVNIKSGKGNYLLFQGKLSVKDNAQAAWYLIETIAKKVDFKIIIAGLNPSDKLQKAAQKQSNVQLRANVSDTEMNDLSQNAQVHFLWTYQKAGMKLKLLKALFTGRYCIANRLMVEHTGLENLCDICESTEEILATANRLMNETNFSDKEIAKRKAILETAFSNQQNIKKTITLIWK